MGLRWFRDRTAIPALARDNKISRATGYRYVDEVIDLLAQQAPDLHEALQDAAAGGEPYVILDGKLFAPVRFTDPGRRRFPRRRHRRPHPDQTPQNRQKAPTRGRQPHLQHLLRGLRALGERGFALLTQRWQALKHITASPRKIHAIVHAALTHHEHSRIH
ncbi:hypothetical protein ACH347_42350 [Saccharopolyspora sp. 5N102]|uniref:hypothetical protein n=1 Tax=Saccharopolyspora sp. 5N102 TaxID=3375155 RepID=UPI0037B70A6D